MDAIKPLSSFEELLRLAKDDDRYRKLALFTAEHVGKTTDDVDEALHFLQFLVGEMDEATVVREVNFYIPCLRRADG